MKAKITVSRAVQPNESPCSKLQGIKEQFDFIPSP
jgi:hypothetical protein